MPRAVAHATDKLAAAPGGLQRHGLAVDREHMAAVGQAADLHFYSFQRGIDIAHRGARRAFFAHDVPRFERHAQFQLHAAHRVIAQQREAEGVMRCEPLRVEVEPGLAQFGEHVIEVHRNEGGQQEAVVQRGAPALQCGGVGRVPEAGDERAQQQLLHHAHAGVRRHLESAQFEQAEAAGGAVRAVELVNAELAAVGIAGDVDQEVAQGAIDKPSWGVDAVARAAGAQLGQGDFEFVDLIVARFVHPRSLAGGADEQAREQIAQAGMVVPVGDQAGQQIGASQEGAVGRGGAAEHHMVAAASAGMATVEHELLRTQPGFKRGLVEEFGVIDDFRPVVRRVDVDFDDAGVGRDLQQVEPRVARRRVAFEHQLDPQALRRSLYGGEQFKIVFRRNQRRHEHIQNAAARLHAQRGAQNPAG